MFEDYKKEVLDFYVQKKATHELPAALENPERLKLRKEVLKVFSKKNRKEDIEIIQSFFDPFNQTGDYVKAIERFELDKFRPLISFLTKGKGIRDEEPVKLLAWLIDFLSYREWKEKKYGGKQNEQIGYNEVGEDSPVTNLASERQETEETNYKGDIGKSMFMGANLIQQYAEDEAVEEVKGEPLQEQFPKIEHVAIGFWNFRQYSKFNFISSILFVFLIGILGLGSYEIFWQKKFVNALRKPLPSEKCMYWNGTNYEPIDCATKDVTKKVVPLNMAILNGLKKIGLADTLTRKSIGKIWYAKRGGEYEYFTDSGRHPVDSQKRLRPLSAYILTHHISNYRFRLQILGYVVIPFFIIVCLALFLRKKSA